MVGIRAQLDGGATVQEVLRNLAQQGQRMRPLMKRIGEKVIVPSLRETLDSGGRGRWPAERRAVRKHKYLGAEGKISKKLKVVANDTSVEVGTTSGYGVWAQRGFTGRIRAEVPRKGKVMRMLTSDGVRFATRVSPHTVTVPPRPFLILVAEDEEAIVAEVTRTLDRLAKREANAGEA